MAKIGLRYQVPNKRELHQKCKTVRKTGSKNAW